MANRWSRVFKVDFSNTLMPTACSSTTVNEPIVVIFCSSDLNTSSFESNS